jgi:hypothetical protein
LGELIPIVLFLMLGAVGMSYSPLGRALARRIAGEKATMEEAPILAEVDVLREELHGLRQELGDVQERVDFAERLLAQVRAKEVGPGGK